METPGKHNISPEEAHKLTPFTFTETEWTRLGSTEAYDPNRTFYGKPEQTVDGGTIFKEFYDENGNYYGGTIAGHPKQDQ